MKLQVQSLQRVLLVSVRKFPFLEVTPVRLDDKAEAPAALLRAQAFSR